MNSRNRLVITDVDERVNDCVNLLEFEDTVEIVLFRTSSAAVRKA